MAHKYRKESNWLNADTWAFINSLSFKDYILAGNSVANLSANIPLQGDLDFWVQYTDDYIPVLHEMMPWYRHMNIYPSLVELYNDDGLLPKVNLMLTNMTPEETIDRFDFDYCRCYWTPTTGIVYGRGSKESIETKVIKHPDYGTKNKRILKAVKYGYRLSNNFWRGREHLLNRRVDNSVLYSGGGITLADLNMSQFKYTTPILSITDINNVAGTLNELALQYQELLYNTNNNTGLPVLISFSDFKANKNLIDQYVNAIILINPMSNARYQDIRLGDNFVYYYQKLKDIDIKRPIVRGSRQIQDDLCERAPDRLVGRHELISLIEKAPGRTHFDELTDGPSVQDKHFELQLPLCPRLESEKIPLVVIDPIIASTESLSDPTIPSLGVQPREPYLFSNIVKEKVITPISGTHQMIQLNESGTAYLMIDHLPHDLSIVGTTSFEALYDLHPQDKHKIIMYENEVPVFRYSKSYLNTPINLDHTKTRSYMYSGLITDENTDPLPDLLVPFYDYIKTIDPKYNQVICNWYENGKDYIASHSDCQRGMISNASVAILSLYDTDEVRTLELIPKAGTRSVADKFTVKLIHGSIVTMCGTTNNEFIHGIPKHETECGRRMSVSFRQMSE